MISLWPMPFLPFKASARILNVPTTSSPALDLAFASTRSFRAALRFLRCLVLFFRAACFLCTVLRFSHTVVCFLAPSFFARLGSCLDSNVLEATVSTRQDVHLLLIPDTDLGAYSRGSYRLFSVRYEFHAFRDDDTKSTNSLCISPRATSLAFAFVAKPKASTFQSNTSFECSCFNQTLNLAL